MANPDTTLTTPPLEPMIREAGEIALRHFGRVTPQQKADRSFVTDADREVERFVVRELRERFPGHCVWGEEYGVSAEEDSPYVWAIDPIDGTAGFLSLLPSWSISIGLFVEGVPRLGMVFLPVLDELYTGDPEHGARLNEEPIQVEHGTGINQHSTLLTSDHSFRDVNIDWPGRTWGLSSTAANVCYAARGAVTASLTSRTIHSYDLAAATAILMHAGGELRHISGALVDFRRFLKGGCTGEDSVACHPDRSEAVRSCIRPK